MASVGPTYGVRLLVLTELNQDGSDKTGAKVVRVTTPQQVSFDPQIIEGSRQELRGGDGLVATVEDDDVLVGMNATFQDAVLDFEAMAMIGGGTLVGTPPNYTGYIPNTVAQEKANPRLPFKAEIYAAEYAEGSQDSSDVVGYVKVTLWNAKGRIPTFAQQDRNFAVPSYTIKSRENKAQSKPAFTIDKVANLPA
ncbi:MAG: hypothetical protein HPY52_10795 [Firmicutes bacterium]|nr:hypothetical protein [Bacillota bacterium]